MKENGIVFILVCGGRFTMGSADGDRLAYRDEKPAHEVTLSKFWIGKFEITNEQFRSFRPEHYGEARLPVVEVSWSTAMEYCESLGYQLPTEAQWEYAARAGTKTPWSFGDDESYLGRYAWYAGNSEGKVHAIGEKAPNSWGLYDMHGNVWEWVHDWYGLYSADPETDPMASTPSKLRVVRGGSSGRDPRWLRSAYRLRVRPDRRGEFIGFRCVRRQH